MCSPAHNHLTEVITERIRILPHFVLPVKLPIRCLRLRSQPSVTLAQPVNALPQCCMAHFGNRRIYRRWAQARSLSPPAQPVKSRFVVFTLCFVPLTSQSSTLSCNTDARTCQSVASAIRIYRRWAQARSLSPLTLSVKSATHRLLLSFPVYLMHFISPALPLTTRRSIPSSNQAVNCGTCYATIPR